MVETVGFVKTVGFAASVSYGVCRKFGCKWAFRLKGVRIVGLFGRSDRRAA